MISGYHVIILCIIYKFTKKTRQGLMSEFIPLKIFFFRKPFFLTEDFLCYPWIFWIFIYILLL